MDGFTYTNIFETKALEYLAIVFFFAILVPFWLFLNKKEKPSVQAQIAAGVLTASSLRLPQGIFFSKFHTWAHMEKTGEAKVGLDDLLLHLTGEVKIIHFKTTGDEINKGEPLVRIKYNGNSLQATSPVSGEIKGTNELLAENPKLVREDPYQHGWIYTIKPNNWKTDTDSCFLAEDATNWAVQELERFKEFLAGYALKVMPESSQVVMQDGGEIIENALTGFPQEVWEDFQKNFLS
jgi:glycine cleavage system H protein